MFLQTVPEKKSGRVLLMFAEGYRLNGKVKQRMVERIGYLDEFIDQYKDPIAHFKALGKQKTLEKKLNLQSFTLTCHPDEILSTQQDNVKNIGYMVLSRLYHELGIRQFMLNRQRNLKINYRLDDIFRMLIFSRILYPSSKKSAFEQRKRLFEKGDYSQDDMYRSLTLFDKYAADLKVYLHKQVCERYGRNTELVYYDVTNYYFETDEADELRKKGVSKEHRPDPIVQMGLLMDQQGLPITYELFPGNTVDCETLMPVLHDVRKQFQVGRFVVVADRGLNTSSNTGMALAKGDGYVYGQSILKASQEMKGYCIDEAGYQSYGKDEEGFKLKSRIVPRKIRVENVKGKRVEVEIDEKQVFFYSEKYAKRARAQRQEALDKAVRFIASPAQYLQAASYGAAKYIKGLDYDKKTGEILHAGKALFLDEEKIAKEAQYDGYYALVSSELDKDAREIMDMYRGLWQIEESFKITKSELKSRPVHVWTKEHIRAHFLTCFVSLLLLRLVQLKTEHKVPLGQLVEAMRRMNGVLLENNIYGFGYFTDACSELAKVFSLPFQKKYLKENEIQKLKKWP